MRRVRVRWHTTEVTDWDATFEIDDDVDPDDLYDGNETLLVDYEDEQFEKFGSTFDEFTRDVDAIEVLGQ